MSELIGSWKIIDIRLPRSRRRLSREYFRMSSPRNFTRVSGLTVARLDKSPMTRRAVTDFPEPDSPTMAIVSPRYSWNEIS